MSFYQHCMLKTNTKLQIPNTKNGFIIDIWNLEFDILRLD
jgi:hypothetical protein